MDLLVSIIIPTYKTEMKLLDRCISSIEKSTYNNYEILVIDDGNKKDYAELLDKLECEYIKIIHIDHAGLSAARNAGILNANGNYITFVDADDTISSTFLQEAVSVMVKFDLDIICGGIRYEDAKNSSQYKEYKIKKESSPIPAIYESENKAVVINSLFYDKLPATEFENSINCNIASKLYKKELVQNNLYDDRLIIAEDRVFNLEVFSKANRIGFLDSIWYTYYQYSTSLIHSYNANIIPCTEMIFQHCIEIEKKHKLSHKYACKFYISSIYIILYIDILNKKNNYSFLQNRKRLLKFLNTDVWSTISKQFIYDALPVQSKLFGFFARNKLPSCMILYYAILIKLRNLIK